MFAIATKKPCPFCGKRIQRGSYKCMFCGEFLERVAGWSGGSGAMAAPEIASRPKGDWLVPEGFSRAAVAACYLGILSFIPAIGLLFGLAAIALGPIAFRQLNLDPRLSGKNRAMTGLILGAIGTLFNIFVVANIVLSLIGDRSGPGMRFGRPLE